MIVIALGANLPSRAGAPRETLSAALRSLSAHDIRLTATSSYYVTKAWPDPSDPPFVNAVARVETELLPRELLVRLHRIEESFGRKREKKNAPRTLDIDLIAYDDLAMTTAELILPHPRALERAFVLLPLAELVPERFISGVHISDALARVDQTGIEKLPPR